MVPPVGKLLQRTPRRAVRPKFGQYKSVELGRPWGLKFIIYRFVLLRSVPKKTQCQRMGADSVAQPALFFEPGLFPGLPGPAVGPNGPEIGKKTGPTNRDAPSATAHQEITPGRRVQACFCRQEHGHRNSKSKARRVGNPAGSSRKTPKNPENRQKVRHPAPT